jgi:hypothetical protein
VKLAKIVHDAVTVAAGAAAAGQTELRGRLTPHELNSVIAA